MPFATDWKPDQARLLQKLAWDVIENYPDCGLYKDGAVPVGKPSVAPKPKESDGVTPVSLSSPTPGAWFRYMLDGTIPTRVRGYVYFGMVSPRPGMELKAVAYKSGMADSPVTEHIY